jgi:AsmA protein
MPREYDYRPSAAQPARLQRLSPEADMSKTLKIVGIIVVVLILIVIALPFLINVNKFKPELESQMTTALGRKVELGNIALSILSGGVKVDDVSIADDPAFSKSPFLQAKQVTAGVALLPLIFSGKLAVSSFTVTEPQVSLLKSSSGVWNFSTIGGSSKEPKSSTSGATNISVEKLAIKNGTIVVGTAGAHGKAQAYQNVNLEVSDLSTTSQFPFKFSAKTPGNGEVKVDGKAGPVNATDSSLTPLDAKVSVENLDIASSGMVDPAAGLAGVIDFKGDVASDGHEVNSKGTVKADKVKLVAKGSPATTPVNVDYATTFNLKSQTGNLKQGDIRIGKAVMHLTGSYNAAGAVASVNMKLNGQGMPIADLEGMMPAAGVSLPSGAKLESGGLDLNLALNGPVDKLVITGPVNLSNAKIAGYSLKSKLGALSSMTGLGGGGGGGSDTEIQTLSTDLRVDPAQTQTNNLNVVVPSMGTVTGNGTVSAAGNLDYKMSAKLAGAMGAMTSVATLGGGKNSNGGAIPFSIKGTTSNPIFVPDVAGMATGMAGGLAKGAVGAPVGGAEAATGALGGMFGKKKKN